MGKTIAHRLTSSSNPFADSKDAVKFICKDLWFTLFRQQASRLQASKRGVYIIHDSNFPRLHTISKCVQNFQPQVEEASATSSFTEHDQHSTPVSKFSLSQMELTAGILEGFLLVRGFKSSVECVLSASLPSCSFQVSILESTNVMHVHVLKTSSQLPIADSAEI